MEEQFFNMIVLAAAPAFAQAYGSSNPHLAARDTLKFAHALMKEIKENPYVAEKTPIESDNE